MKYVLLICFFCATLIKTNAQNKQDEILGKWESTEKNLIVQVYKDGNIYRAKVLWFSNTDTLTPVEQKMDLKNPNKSLRTRKIVGLDVLSGMVYNPKQNKYFNGKIYDSSSGKTYNATAWLSDANTLNVRGYYLVRLLGKTLDFKRV